MRIRTTNPANPIAILYQNIPPKSIPLDKINRRNFEDVSSGSAISENHIIKILRTLRREQDFGQKRMINFEDVSSGSAIFEDRFIKIFAPRGSAILVKKRTILSESVWYRIGIEIVP